jgi:ribonuclease T2
MTSGSIWFTVPVLIALSGALAAPLPKKAKKEPPAVPVVFDYYVLSLSWAPEFCSQPDEAAAHPRECASGRGVGFVVHGLWPEVREGKSPESCESTQRVPKNVVNLALPYMMSTDLLQHEWAAHGTCTGLSATDYFFDLIQARSAVQIPIQLISVEVPVSEGLLQIEDAFQAINTSFPKGAFRAACRNASLSEVRICFARDLKPVECPARLGECPESGVNIRPVR